MTSRFHPTGHPCTCASNQTLIQEALAETRSSTHPSHMCYPSPATKNLNTNTFLNGCRRACNGAGHSQAALLALGGGVHAPGSGKNYHGGSPRNPLTAKESAGGAVSKRGFWKLFSSHTVYMTCDMDLRALLSSSLTQLSQAAATMRRRGPPAEAEYRPANKLMQLRQSSPLYKK